ncbi:g487 [Coccomyxa elongata]
MALFTQVPDCRFVVASARSVIGVSHDFEDDFFKVQKCPDIPGDRCYGLFAKHNIPSETPLGEYIGTILNRKKSEELCECKRVYLFQVSEDRYIDASDPLNSSVIRYINHPSDGESSNAPFVKRAVKGLGVRWRIFAVTTRDIKAGEELLCLYDETPGDHDPTLTMSKRDARSALRKRTAEVARLRDHLAESKEATEAQRLTASYWKRQCSKIAAAVSHDERQLFRREIAKLLPSSDNDSHGGSAASNAGRYRPTPLKLTPDTLRKSDSSEDTS